MFNLLDIAIQTEDPAGINKWILLGVAVAVIVIVLIVVKILKKQ